MFTLPPSLISWASLQIFRILRLWAAGCMTDGIPDGCINLVLPCQPSTHTYTKMSQILYVSQYTISETLLQPESTSFRDRLRLESTCALPLTGKATLTGKGTAGLWIRWGIRDEIIKIAKGVEPSALHWDPRSPGMTYVWEWRCYFPMQKFRKMLPKTSSVEISPTMEPRW